MKNLIFALTLVLSITMCAQNKFENTNIFVRVYDLQGNKIHKGDIASISETSLQLKKRGETINIPASSIGSVKSKYSGGTNVLIGALAGLGAGVISGDPVIVAVGTAAGAAVGGATILFKKSQIIDIGGDGTKLTDLEKLVVD